MLIEPQGERFSNTTRGRLVALLRRGPRTADELARALGVSDSAVRVHLTSLERDGLVQRNGRRRGASKPAYAYELTRQAERLFPQAYERVLNQLLDVLWERLPPGRAEDIVRETGRRVADADTLGGGGVVRGADPRGRLQQAMALFGELGGLPELTEDDGALRLHSYACPLAGLVTTHPQLCRLAEALLAAIVGEPVQEECLRGDPPHCAFRLSLPGS